MQQSGRDYSKRVTSTTGVGVGTSATPNSNIVEPIKAVVPTTGNLQYEGEDESIHVLTGPGGDDTVSNPEVSPHRWGHVAPSGSRIEVNDSGGSENITIVHHTGSAVVIDPDGSVYITSDSARGAGISAPKGDFFISSGGDVVINGKGNMSISTSGDLNLSVGGVLTVKAEVIKTICNTHEEIVDGTKVSNITNDSSSIIGGIKRETIAGDTREQVSGKKIIDVAGDFTTSVDGNNNINVGKDAVTAVNGDVATSSKNATIASSSNMKVSAGSDMAVYGNNTNVTGQGSATVYSGGSVKLTGSSVNASPYVDLAGYSNQAGVAEILGGTNKPSPQAGSGVSAADIKEAQEAQTVDSEDIIDTLTSVRKYPEYGNNAVLESANATGYSMVEHDRVPGAEGAYREYSGGNKGNVNPAYQGGVYDSIDPTINRKDGIEGQAVTGDVPARGNNSTLLSKYFTLGQLTKPKEAKGPRSYIPSEKWDTIVSNLRETAVNVLDPIKERFPDITLTSTYRNNSPNHITGFAVDLVDDGRRLSMNAEIARFAIENLPVDQVFLEKNESGRTHVHVRYSRSGGGNPVILTCGDKDCHAKLRGKIDIGYLVKRGVANT